MIGPTFGSDKSLVNVFKKLMFSAHNKPVIVSTNPENLILVMSTMSGFEKEIRVSQLDFQENCTLLNFPGFSLANSYKPCMQLSKLGSI